MCRLKKDGERPERDVSSERGGLGDSRGLLQRRRRWTACDDWRLSVERKGRKRQREEDERDMGGVRCVESDMKACGWIQMWDNY